MVCGCQKTAVVWPRLGTYAALVDGWHLDPHALSGVPALVSAGWLPGASWQSSLQSNSLPSPTQNCTAARSCAPLAAKEAISRCL